MLQKGGLSVALGTSPRGAGLGNEVIAWCKSYIAARELGLTLIPPAWATSRSRLYQDFGYTFPQVLKSNVIASRGNRLLISEAAFRATGELDYGAAVKKIYEAEAGCRGEPPKVLVNEGMWGGYLGIASARNFLRSRILNVQGVPEAVDRAQRGADDRVIIGVHVRRGDFAAAPPREGEFNKAIPLIWYCGLVKSLYRSFEGRVRFQVATDGDPSDIVELLSIPGVELVRGAGRTAAIQELAVLLSADAVVCSVSSFSMLAAFLSEKPYFWYRDQLSVRGDRLTLWGSEATQLLPDSATSRNYEAGVADLYRGVPWGSGEIPDHVVASVGAAARFRAVSRNDLLFYGTVPDERRFR